MALNLEQMLREFQEFSLDPELVNQQQLLGHITFLSKTMDISSPAAVKIANSAIASVTQLVYYKLARTEYWYEVLKRECEKIEAFSAKLAYDNEPDLNKTQLEATVNVCPDVVTIKDRMVKSYAAYKYWANIVEMLKAVSFRVDSSEKTITAESRVNPVVRS